MAAQRYPRSARLLRKREFERVFASPLRRSGLYFRGQMCPSPSGEARLGLGISRRAASLAVDRNRIRRIARESFRRLRAELPPNDFLINGKPGIGAVDNAELRADFEALLRRLSALKPSAAPGTMSG